MMNHYTNRIKNSIDNDSKKMPNSINNGALLLLLWTFNILQGPSIHLHQYHLDNASSK
jgi:hypothetical protein